MGVERGLYVSCGLCVSAGCLARIVVGVTTTWRLLVTASNVVIVAYFPVGSTSLQAGRDSGKRQSSADERVEGGNICLDSSPAMNVVSASLKVGLAVLPYPLMPRLLVAGPAEPGD